MPSYVRSNRKLIYVSERNAVELDFIMTDVMILHHLLLSMWFHARTIRTTRDVAKAECWNLISSYEKLLLIFERKMVREVGDSILF